MRTDKRATSRAGRRTALLGLAAASVSLLIPGSASAQASERADRDAPEAAVRAERQMALAVLYRDADTNRTRSVWASLTCDPDGGTHLRAAEACDELRAVDGELELLRGGDELCTKVYEPVVVLGVGRWDGRKVQFGQRFSNACEMEAATGAVFDFRVR